MRKIKPIQDNKHTEYFDPMSIDGITPKCVCGYVLIKDDENTYHCEGGNHRYIMDIGDIIFDKFGRVLIKKPKPNKDKEVRNE